MNHLDEIYADINALGGYTPARTDYERAVLDGYNRCLDDVLAIVMEHGGMDPIHRRHAKANQHTKENVA